MLKIIKKKKIGRSSPIKIGKSSEFYINIINSKCAKISKKKWLTRKMEPSNNKISYMPKDSIISS